MRSRTLLLLLPVAAVLGGCLSYGDPVYTYSHPTYMYSQPAYAYTYPSHTYSSPAIVAPSGSYYYAPGYSSRYGANWNDHDGDGVANNADRHPYDRHRW